MLAFFRIMRDLAVQLKGENFHRVLIVLLLLIFLGSVAFLFFEQGLGFLDALWWSVVTVTTVGYGDISPATIGGRIVGVVLMMMGIGFLGVLTATIAGLFVENKILENRGMKAPDVEGQIIICGWNQRGEEVIAELRADSKTRETPIIIIAELAEKPITDKSVHFLAGGITEEILVKAKADKASVVIMLADETADPNLRDAKTILDILTIKTHYPDAYVCVELMQTKNISHCRLAKADEIIVVGQLSSNLLVQAALDHGITGMVSELVSNRHGNELYMIETPHQYEGRSFLDVMIALKKEHGILCLGVKDHSRKDLITNPDSDYQLKKDDKLVVIALDRPELA